MLKHEKLNAGFGRADITPQLGVRLGGYGVKERPAEEIFDRLHATAMVLGQAGRLTVVISLDWGCIAAGVIERIRREVHQRVGIPAPHVTVCATHTHSAPNTFAFQGWGGVDEAYVAAVLPEICRSVEMAHANLRPVRVGFAVTESLVGVNRRGILENGEVRFMADPHAAFDPTMTVAHFKDESGADAGILVHYGAHGTAMGSNRLVSRDWCGVMQDRIESQFTAPVLFLNGAIGDVGPRTNFRHGACLAAGEGDGIDAVREVGYRAATDAMRALLAIREWRAGLQLDILNAPIFLPHAPLKPLAAAERDMAQWAERKDEWGEPMCEYMYNQAVVAAHAQPALAGRQFSQTITAIGPLVLAPMPGEIFSGISLRIRAGSPFQYTLCCSVANGSLAYLPTREARHRGGYEIWAGRAVGAHLLADNIDDVLVAENLKLLRQISAG